MDYEQYKSIFREINYTIIIIVIPQYMVPVNIILFEIMYLNRIMHSI